MRKQDTAATIPEIRPGQSLELLKELHILTRDGKLNQDTRRKLKQVYHLYQFIEPLLAGAQTVADHGAGKSYLGFILYDLYFRERESGHIFGIETRRELVEKSRELAARLDFGRMSFFHATVEEATRSTALPERIDVVTALHACNTATDDAIRFALTKKAKHIVLVPCCQAEVAAALRASRRESLAKTPLAELWRHPIHARELGSHLTNVLRCLLLEAHGYDVTVTELVGWEHSLKNELIIASKTPQNNGRPRQNARERAAAILREFNIEELAPRFTY
ncbi:MAG: SAM-dependent methyltransferase [Dechloromonas sp.]|uniref:SAM-dependent methyltransferase n=1 Tax=Candidatus Dechloromonas phosphorivorans TaxID=2899244 RepID=A0A9D7LW45_9RHOO|nr:SAM-dependent methyltransferase [Candidatus Dechloromonas phosphorivorans]